MIADLCAGLWLFAIVGGSFAIFGGLNDGRNTYPLPLLLASVVAVAVAEMLPLI